MIRRASFWRAGFVAVVAALVGLSSISSALVLQGVAAASTAQTTPEIVVLKDGTSVTQVITSIGATPIDVYTSAFVGFAASLTAQQIAALRTNAAVVSVTPDRTLHVGRRFRKQPGNDVAQIIGRGVRRVGILNSPTAHIGKPGPPVNASIAILDSGIDPHHPDLNVVGGYNCTTPNRFAWRDDEGHGTMVAGLAAARDNAIDIVGIAPGARLWAIKVLDANLDATDASILCGVDWVAAHAASIDVANMSFGGQPDNSTPGQHFDDTTCGRNDGDILHTAVCRIHDRGVVQVAAAGNQAIDTVLVEPAAYPEVITVSGLSDTDGQPGGLGGLDACGNGLADDIFAPFSDYGAPVDVAAPANCVSSDYPEPDAIATDSGTSFAAPYVSGAAALLRARYPHLSPDRIEAIIKATASPGPLPGDPDQHHEGVLNVSGY